VALLAALLLLLLGLQANVQRLRIDRIPPRFELWGKKRDRREDAAVVEGDPVAVLFVEG